MVENNFSTHKPLPISSSTPVQNERTQGNNAARPQNFEPARGKNPCHDGCNLSQEQVEETKAAEPAQQSQQSASTEKASGNCPGSNIIANILQELMATLQDIKI